jgi:hypothetical protein
MGVVAWIVLGLSAAADLPPAGAAAAAGHAGERTGERWTSDRYEMA